MSTRSLVTSLPLGALSTLAILGVASFVAVAAVIHEPTSSGQGVFPANEQPGTLAIARGNAQSGDRGPRSLNAGDVDAIAHSVPNIAAVSRVLLGIAPVAARQQTAQVRIQGVDATYLRITSGAVAPGVFFSLQDATAANPVAILGQTLAVSLFARDSPVGQTIHIRNVPFTVVGVLASQQSPPTESADDAVLIPFQTGQIRLFGPNALDLLLLQLRDPSQANAARLQVQQVLRQRHQVRAGQPDDFTIRTNGGASTGDATETPPQVLGRLLQQYRQYVCEAKGLCARAQ